MAYHTESIKPTNAYDNRSVSSPDISNFNYQSLIACCLLMISISWEAVKNKSNNSLKGWRKQLQDTAWKSAPNNNKNPRQHHPAKAIRQQKNKWKSARRSGPVQILELHTNQGWNISKEVHIRLVQLSHDKASNTMEKRICMATGRQELFYYQSSSVAIIIVWPCLPFSYAVDNHTTRNSGW